MLKLSSEKELVGQIPTHPPQSMQSSGVKAGMLFSILIVAAGQISTHFWQVECTALALTQDDRLKFNFTYCSDL